MADDGGGAAPDLQPLAFQAAEVQPPTPGEAGEPAVPDPVPAQSISVPGQTHYLKWWTLVLVLIGVWIPAAGIGLGLYYWWFQDQSPHKTLPVFAVLVYVVISTVAGLLLAMVDRKPLIAAVAIAVMAAPFASCAGAAPLYGHYYCQYAPRCVAGLVPY